MNQIIHKKEIFFYISISLIGYFSLLFGFFNNEDLVGGAIQDFNFYVGLLNRFSNDFLYSFLNYKDMNSDHSPFFISLLTIINIPLENFNLINVKSIDTNDKQSILLYGHKYNFLRFIFLHICILVPFLLFKCLKIIFKDCNNITLFLLSITIILSPHFRAYAIWTGETNLGLLFLICSIYFYLKLIEINQTNKISHFKFIFFNVLFLALSAHSRPIYSLISIFFFFKYIEMFKFNIQTIQFIFLNLVFAFPAFYYFVIQDNYPFVLYSNFFYQPNLSLYSTNILLTSSILFFYFMPFLIINYKTFIKQNFLLSKKNMSLLFFAFLITIIFIFNFDYNNAMNGGGVYFKFSNKFFDSNNFFFIVSFISIYFILKIIVNRDFNDLILIFIIFCFDPDPWIYHKSFDPIVFCLLITLFKNELFSELNNKNEKIYSNIILIYYTLIFLMYIFIKPNFLI